MEILPMICAHCGKRVTFVVRVGHKDVNGEAVELFWCRKCVIKEFVRG